MLVRPEKVALVVCPNDHTDNLVVIAAGEEGEELRYHVVRAIHLFEGHGHTYRYPPVDFVVALLQGVLERCPNMPLAIGFEKCADCQGFEDPGFYRKPFRYKE